jgi:hypothetical protein
MAQLSGVTLNLSPTSFGANFGASDVSADGFDEVYGATKSASPANGSSARPSPTPPVGRASEPNHEAYPRLDLKTSVEGTGTRIDATITPAGTPSRGTGSTNAGKVSLFVGDASAESVTQALSDILDSPDAATAAASATDPELAEKLLAQLRLLLEDLAGLFPGLDLDFFNALPPPTIDLPDLDRFTFVDIYDQRLWQMAWSNSTGAGNYSVEDMFPLSLQSATISSLALAFNADIINAMTDQPNGVRR